MNHGIYPADVKKRPILFSAPMVCAILEGRKTQTRRICKPAETSALSRVIPAYKSEDGEQRPPYITPGWFGDEEGDVLFFCPYGQPGDRLWVREACRGWTFDTSGENVVRYDADGAFTQIENTQDGADRWIELYNYHGKRGATVPSIHMPRWASRILLEIVGVRVERLQDISVGDCCAEGAPLDKTHAVESWYQELWENINGHDSWVVNPWVWVVEFKVVKP